MLSPYRQIYRPPQLHDGKITTEGPNIMWGSDGTKVMTLQDRWVWIFTVADQRNTECAIWHVCKKGDRFEALKPVSMGVKQIYGSLSKGVVRGLKLRIDHGSFVHIRLFFKPNSSSRNRGLFLTC